jgi:DNA gyrase subunit A
MLRRVFVGDAIPDARRGLSELDELILRELRSRGHGADQAFVITSELLAGDALGATQPRAYGRVVALAQEFTTRYPLIAYQGNFGSIDDDPPADAQYTECRLSAAGEAAIDDGRFPSLLLNGAFGSKTVIPPHNLQNVLLAASAHLIDPEAPLERLADLVGGPDFPTGGVITGGDPLAQIYSTGRGRLVLEARMHFEHGRRPRLVITELPYRVCKGGDHGVVWLIAELVHDRQLTQLTDLWDDSDRNGMRVVVGLRSEHDYDQVRQALLELTPLRTTIDVDMVATVDGAPRTMNLRELVAAHVDHRRSVLGPNSDPRIRAELNELASRCSSPRRTAIEQRA